MNEEENIIMGFKERFEERFSAEIRPYAISLRDDFKALKEETQDKAIKEIVDKIKEMISENYVPADAVKLFAELHFSCDSGSVTSYPVFRIEITFYDENEKSIKTYKDFCSVLIEKSPFLDLTKLKTRDDTIESIKTRDILYDIFGDLDGYMVPLEF